MYCCDRQHCHPPKGTCGHAGAVQAVVAQGQQWVDLVATRDGDEARAIVVVRPYHTLKHPDGTCMPDGEMMAKAEVLRKLGYHALLVCLPDSLPEIASHAYERQVAAVVREQLGCEWPGGEGGLLLSQRGGPVSGAPAALEGEAADSAATPGQQHASSA